MACYLFKFHLSQIVLIILAFKTGDSVPTFLFLSKLPSFPQSRRCIGLSVSAHESAIGLFLFPYCLLYTSLFHSGLFLQSSDPSLHLWGQQCQARAKENFLFKETFMFKETFNNDFASRDKSYCSKPILQILAVFNYMTLKETIGSSTQKENKLQIVIIVPYVHIVSFSASTSLLYPNSLYSLSSD